MTGGSARVVAIAVSQVVVGVAFSAGGAPPSKEAIPGFVRAYDIHTGALRWTFHTIPQEGELGVDTWSDESWRYTGNTGVWITFVLVTLLYAGLGVTTILVLRLMSRRFRAQPRFDESDAPYGPSDIPGGPEVTAEPEVPVG